MYFKVFALCKELNLNKIAQHFGIMRKFEWEDFFILNEDQLEGLIKDTEGKYVNVFPFGSIVFVNMPHHEITDVVNYLKVIDPNLKDANFDFSDDYSIQAGASLLLDDEVMTVDRIEGYHKNIISTVLAKSVALEKIENDVVILLDEMESVINLLNKYNLKFDSRKVAEFSSRVLGFKYKTLSYIMLLDKPDITWNNQDAEILYQHMAHIFELDERYQKIQAKSDTLMDIIEVFSTLTQNRKANTLEWMIIVLIIIEIVITLTDYAVKFLAK